MCGHVGIAGVLTYDEEKIFKKMLVFDYFRGMDSTGMAAVRHDGSVVGAKVADNPLILFDMNRFKSALNYNQSRVFMGHNRAATRGGVSNGNAHPFNFDHITGTHNGTLTSASTRELEAALGETYPVDSAAIFASIAKFGIEDTIKMMETGRTSSEGAWSLVWHDAVKGTMNFLKNAHRPMWLAYSEDNKRLFWASEWPIIQAGIKVADDKPQTLGQDEDGFCYIPCEDDIWYSFDLDVLRQGNSRPKPKAKKLEGKEPKPIVSTYNPSKDDPFGRNNIGMGYHSPGIGRTQRSRGSNEPLHLVGDNDNPLAGVVTRADFDRMAKHGCAWCNSPIEYTDSGLIIIEQDENILCKECSGDLDVTRIYATGDTLTILANL